MAHDKKMKRQFKVIPGYKECANEFTNWAEGRSIFDFPPEKRLLYEKLAVKVTSQSVLLECPVEGCTAQWAVRKDEEARLYRRQREGEPLCGEN